MDYIRLRLLMYKAESRKSYKTIASEAGINYDCFIKFTSGRRGLTDSNMDKLLAYLSAQDKNKGES